ncbi:winged helix-turn-helix domain-containing protein [Candidatus Oscillochloris fontis]|uniref:winged helix-turn-helix domain-containing protein n=1 Tax=Candidatus Oscillochloris fontis TaxID=2496868 RepID=UPI00101DD058|nr:winged helix-turn-helix domain-containing protein [Candidatus Oscillochloris fontis]
MLDPRPITYRAEIIEPLIQHLAAGECCSIVGINGIGKTNMLQHLQRFDVIAHYITGNGEPLAFCSLDANMLAEPSGWGFFEGLTVALRVGLRTLLPEVALQRISEEHAAILAAYGNYPMALRRCSNAINVALDYTRLVIILDEFDALLPQISTTTLRNLRALRDRYKYRLMYLALTRERLPTLCPDMYAEESESFLELFSLGEEGLPPLRHEDAQRETVRFSSRYQQTIPPAEIERIIDLSGGHPSLIRTLVQVVLEYGTLSDEPRLLMRRAPNVRNECLKIWNDLSDEEQDLLWQAHHHRKLDLHDHADLSLKGLLKPHADGWQIFSPLLDTLVAGEIARTASVTPNDSQPDPISINPTTQQVYYYGREIGDQLPRLQFVLLAYLYARYGTVCSEEELYKAVYPDESEIDLSSDRIGVLVRRLSKRLQRLVPHQPKLIHTARGRGYRLGLPS